MQPALQGLVCPSCSARLKVKDELVGKAIKCPNCGTRIAVPANGGRVAKASPPDDPLGTADHKPGAATPGPDVTRTFGADPPAGAGVTAGFLPGQGTEPNETAPASGLPTIPGYRVLSEIARGGMGKVLAAFDLTLDREVALKVLLPGANADRFVRESKITARLPHPGIPPVHALGTLADGSPFLAMKLIAGQTLAEEMKTADRPRLLQAFAQVCQAVGFAHSRGIIHRDLKPANVMVGAFGEVQVMDWGLAKDSNGRGPADEPRLPGSTPEPVVGTDANHTTGHPASGESADDQTQAGAVMGTPAYMAPEQARGEPADARADVFALGGILCAILTGQPPFVGKSALEVIKQAAAADLAEVNARLDACGADAELLALCRRCLNPSAADRPANGQAVADGLTAYLNGVQEQLQAVERERAVAVARETEQRKRRRVQFILAAAVLLVLVAGVAVSAYFAFDANSQANAAKREALRARNAAAGEAAQTKIAEGKAKEADDKTSEALLAGAAEKKAKDEALLAGVAEKKAKEEAVTLATKEAEAKEQTRQQLRRAEWSVYLGKLLLAQAAFAENNVPEALRHLDECQWDLRGWESRHLRWRFDSSKQTLQGHTDGVSSVCFSPDGKRILTGSGDHTAKVWDAEKGTELRALKGQSPVTSVCFSPDGKRILTGELNTWAKVWDAENGTELRTLKHTDAVSSVCFSPDGKRIVTGSGDLFNRGKPGEAKVWDAENGTELRALKHTDAVSSVCFSPDGKRIVTGSYDMTAKVWDAAKGTELLTLKGHTSYVLSVCFSPDGRRIVTGSYDMTAKVWDAAKGTELLAHKGHTSTVRSVCFSPDGQRILTGSNDKTAKVWDAAKSTELLTLNGHTQPLTSVCFSPDGKRILTGSADWTAKVWDAEKGTEIRALKHTDAVSSVCFSPDGKRIVTGSYDMTAKVWDAAKGTELLTLKGHRSYVLSVCFSPDGRRILTGSADNTVTMWDAESGTELRVLRMHTGSLTSVCFSPDGKRILTGGGGFDQQGRLLPGEAKVWDAEKGTELLDLKGHKYRVSSVCFSPDGKRILTGGGDLSNKGKPGEVKVWDAEKGTELLALKGHTGEVKSVCFSPDGKRILTGSYDMTAKVWDAEKGTELLALKGYSAPVSSVCFSPDGKRILTGSGGVDQQSRLLPGDAKVWDTAKGTELRALKGHTDRVSSVCFSPDGKRILTGAGELGKPGEAKVWDAVKGTELLALRGQIDGVTSVCFSPDGKRAFAWDAAGKVLAWSVEDGKPLAADNPPPRSAPGSARSPDGRRAANPEGDGITIVDLLQPAPVEATPWPLPAAAQRKAYHSVQVGLAEKEQKWFAVAFHLGRLLLDAPNDANLKKRHEEALKKHAAP